MSTYNVVFLSFCLSLLSACSFEAHMTKPSTNTTIPTTVAPSIVIPNTTVSSNLTTLPISGECPPGVLEVGIYVSSTLAQTLTCMSGSYSGTLDLSAQPDGPIRINIVATTGSTEVFIVKDTVSPTPPTDLSVPLWSNSHSLTPPLSWVNSTDSGTGVLKYQVRVLSSSDNSVIATWQDLTSGGLLNGLALTPAAAYKYELRAQDLSENFSTIVQSTSWYNYIQSKLSIDTTTPYPRLMSVSSQYGSTTALSEDESTLVIGAPKEDFDEANGNYILDAGAVYVYTKVSGTWVFQQKIVAMGTNARKDSDLFGTSVAISGDTIVVGAFQQSYDENGSGYLLNAGAAYVFTRSSGVWSQQQKLIPTGTNARISSDRFGFSVGISGETIVVGSYYHDYDETGANYINSAGAAFVFTRSAGIWTQEKKLIPTGVNARIASDGFGKVSPSVEIRSS